MREDQADAAPDRFVEQLRWVAREAGGTDELARKSKVSIRTLQDWLNGKYPRQRTSRKLAQLDDWALAHLTGYPPEGTATLADLAGPVGLLSETPPPTRTRSRWGRGGDQVDPAGSTGSRRSPRLIIVSALVAVVVVAVTAVIITLIVIRTPDAPAASTSDTGDSALPSGPPDSRSRNRLGSTGRIPSLTPAMGQDRVGGSRRTPPSRSDAVFTPRSWSRCCPTGTGT